MPDLLIRNVDEADVRAIDALAARLGLSRSELLRRQARQLAHRGTEPTTRESFERSIALFSDAFDEDVMKQAW